jgi:endoglucanase
MSEFGAYDKADMDSRVRWTAFMREQAEERGFSWSYWEFGAGFGVYDRSAQKWNQELLEALVPPPE